MSIEPILFWLFAGTAVVGALMAVLLPRIIHSVFSLMLSFVGVAAVYAFAGADFLAVAQVVVYVGGITVMLAFGVLLTGRTALDLGKREVRNRPLGIFVGGLLFAGLVAAISASQFHLAGTRSTEATTEGIGSLLLGDYIIAFEFASILLLAALVGAAYLVRRGKA
jgi:NADH-quinone oxidoreductase subunit J